MTLIPLLESCEDRSKYRSLRHCYRRLTLLEGSSDQGESGNKGKFGEFYVLENIMKTSGILAKILEFPQERLYLVNQNKL